MTDIPIRLVIVDDHALLRQGIVAILRRNPTIEVVGEGQSGADVDQLVAALRPDVLLLDLNMPAKATDPGGARFNYAAAIRILKTDYPETAIAVLTQDDNPYTIQALAALGVDGYLLKSDDLTTILDQLILDICTGRPYFSPAVRAAMFTFAGKGSAGNRDQLSPREVELVRLLARVPEDLSRTNLAELMGISRHTLDVHLKTIYRKLGVSSLASVVVFAIRLGILRPQDF